MPKTIVQFLSLFAFIAIAGCGDQEAPPSTSDSTERNLTEARAPIAQPSTNTNSSTAMSSSTLKAQIGGDIERAAELWKEMLNLPKGDPRRVEQLAEILVLVAEIDPKYPSYFMSGQLQEYDPDVFDVDLAVQVADKTILQISDNDLKNNLYTSISDPIARVDAQKAAEFTLSAPRDFDPNRNALWNPLSIWLSSDPQAASQWALEVEHAQDRNIACTYVIDDLISRQDFDTAREWLTTIADPEERKALADRIQINEANLKAQ